MDGMGWYDNRDHGLGLYPGPVQNNGYERARALKRTAGKRVRGQRRRARAADGKDGCICFAVSWEG
jgi:hypothetical protein